MTVEDVVTLMGSSSYAIRELERCSQVIRLARVPRAILAILLADQCKTDEQLEAMLSLMRDAYIRVDTLPPTG